MADQKLGFCTTDDGVRICYATVGARRRTPGSHRGKLHRDNLWTGRWAQRVPVLGDSAIVHPHHSCRIRCGTGDSSGARPSFVLHPNSRGVSPHGILQSTRQ